MNYKDKRWQANKPTGMKQWVSLSLIKGLDEDPGFHGYSKQHQNEGYLNLAGNLISPQSARFRDVVFCIFVFPYVVRKMYMEGKFHTKFRTISRLTTKRKTDINSGNERQDLSLSPNMYFACAWKQYWILRTLDLNAINLLMHWLTVFQTFLFLEPIYLQWW